MPRNPASLFVVMALWALVGCSPKIGDACLVSTDCSLRGERVCDLSYLAPNDGQLKGECIIDGCSRGNCPKEAECVKIYSTAFYSVACDPAREDVATARPEGCDTPDCISTCEGGTCCLGDTCPPRNDCDANEVCLPEGVCVDEVSARTSCRRECERSSQCRSGYKCEHTGKNGVYQAPSPKDPTSSDRIKICVPDV